MRVITWVKMGSCFYWVCCVGCVCVRARVYMCLRACVCACGIILQPENEEKKLPSRSPPAQLTGITKCPAAAPSCAADLRSSLLGKHRGTQSDAAGCMHDIRHMWRLTTSRCPRLPLATLSSEPLMKSMIPSLPLATENLMLHSDKKVRTKMGYESESCWCCASQSSSLSWGQGTGGGGVSPARADVDIVDFLGHQRQFGYQFDCVATVQQSVTLKEGTATFRRDARATIIWQTAAPPACTFCLLSSLGMCRTTIPSLSELKEMPVWEIKNLINATWAFWQRKTYSGLI